MFTSKKGNLIVDAAITLPIFILAMVLVLSFFLKAGTEDNAVSWMLKASQTESMVFASSGENVVDEVPLYKEGHVLLFRPFTGEKKGVCYDKVYIFPKYGKRYHIDGCSTLQGGEKVDILTDKVRKKYSPCKICEPDKLPNGASVCIYSDSSSVYHRQSCATITKSFEQITKDEAIAKGYTACQICLKTE